MASAMIDRAELPVHRNRTLNGASLVMSFIGYFFCLFFEGVPQPQSFSALANPQSSGWPSQQSVTRKSMRARMPGTSTR
jgi:hypothetical protein